MILDSRATPEGTTTKVGVDATKLLDKKEKFERVSKMLDSKNSINYVTFNFQIQDGPSLVIISMPAPHDGTFFFLLKMASLFDNHFFLQEVLHS